MNSTIAQLKTEVYDKMVKKFGMKIDFDEMEETILTRLLMNQSKNCTDNNDIDKEIRKLKVCDILFTQLLRSIGFKLN